MGGVAISTSMAMNRNKNRIHQIFLSIRPLIEVTDTEQLPLHTVMPTSDTNTHTHNHNTHTSHTFPLGPTWQHLWTNQAR